MVWDKVRGKVRGVVKRKEVAVKAQAYDSYLPKALACGDLAEKDVP